MAARYATGAAPLSTTSWDTIRYGTRPSDFQSILERKTFGRSHPRHFQEQQRVFDRDVSPFVAAMARHCLPASRPRPGVSSTVHPPCATIVARVAASDHSLAGSRIACSNVADAADALPGCTTGSLLEPQSKKGNIVQRTFSMKQKTLGAAVLRLTVAALIATVAAVPVRAEMSHPSPGDSEMSAAMRGLKPATDQMKMIGQVDRDFMLMMIPHHDAGIAMSWAEQGYGKHTLLKQMATVDIADQKKDNRDMRELLKHGSSTELSGSAASTADAAMMNAMHKLDQSLNGMHLTGNQDHDFIMMMIPHHEAAIAMSRTELRYGSDPKVKKIAQGIFDGQSQDVRDMKTWHKTWFGNAYPM